jgi:hypothetical protein
VLFIIGVTTGTQPCIIQTAFEDNYLMVNDIDGPEYADKLRSMMFWKKEEDTVMCEKTWLKSNMV